MNITEYKLQYRGSLFWLIFWVIVFFPIALVLLFTAISFTYGNKFYSLSYGGSRFWLCFWILVCFPVAFILLFVNGFSIRVEELDASIERNFKSSAKEGIEIKN